MQQDGKRSIHIRAGDPGFLETISELWRSRELLSVLVQRQLKSRYAQTAFGTFWVIFQPLMAALLYALVFGVFVKVPTGGTPYVLFSYTAMVVWSLFAQGFDRTGVSLIMDERLITKTYFPRLHLPFAAALSTLPDLLVSFVLLVPVAWAFGYPPGLRLLWVVPSILVPILAAVGAGAVVASLNIRWRDLRQAAPFLVQIWVWATPVAYPLDVVPDRWRPLLLLNPLSAPVMVFRHALLGTPLPPTWSMGASVLSSLFLFSLGCWVFRRVEKTFADYI